MKKIKEILKQIKEFFDRYNDDEILDVFSNKGEFE